MVDEALPPPPPRPPKPRLRPGKLALQVLATLGALLVIAALLLNSPIGHRLIADRIAAWAPASGLRVEVGRIEGSLLGQSTLHDVTFADPQGVFLRVPEIDLDWRPLNWFASGLDVRQLVARRGVLLRAPRLRSSGKQGQLLPDFDIRVDRLELERFTVARGMLGAERRIGLVASADIRDGVVRLNVDGRLGGQDRLRALIDAVPDAKRFDLVIDVAAPRGGLLAGLAGAQQDMRLRVAGKGNWTLWRGGLLAEQGGQRLAAFTLANRSGFYAALGQVRPDGLIGGIARRAMGDVLSLGAAGTFRANVLNGRVAATGAGLRLNAGGTVDLADNAFERFQVKARLSDPELFGAGLRLEGAELSAMLDGPFDALEADHAITVQRLASGKTRLETLTTKGVARYDGKRWIVPLHLAAARIVTGSAAIDPRLVQAEARGDLVIEGGGFSAGELLFTLPGLEARLALDHAAGGGRHTLSGPVRLRGWPLANLGLVDGEIGLKLGLAGGAPWQLEADIAGRMARVDNATLTSLAGDAIRFGGRIGLAQGAALRIERASLDGGKLKLTLAGRVGADGRTVLAGSGEHTQYGPFTVDAALGADGPRLTLVLADPLPAAGLKDVRLALAPVAEGFRIETDGQSRLGPFNGVLGLTSQPGRPLRLAVERLNVWKTAITGTVMLGAVGAAGELDLAGGGVNGTIGLAPRRGGQGIDVALSITDARFGGDAPLVIGAGRIEASGLLAKGRSTISGNLHGEGIGQGSLFIGRVAANARLADGRGQVTATIAGRRGSRFALQVLGDIAPERLAVLASGDFAGQRIAMPRRAVLTAEQGGWRLAPTQVNYAGGRLVASGIISGTAREVDLALADMPLALTDVLVADLGLGGSASGLVQYRAGRGRLPTGTARLMVRGLTRSGLLLTSRPVDAALVADLSATQFDARAVLREGGAVRGRVQARISGLAPQGMTGVRLRAGALFAQLRYDGPADALWRLVALEAFDLNGPVALAADVTGTIDAPRIRGSLASDALRLQSAVIGTDISGIAARGRFSGSRLELTSLSGRAANGGQVAGSGMVDFTNIGSRAPALDLRLALRNARILARDDMAASVTGPLRIVSDGVGGTIAGRLAIDSARWQLGRAAAAEQLPVIRTREINRRADIAPPRATGAPWRFLIDAAGDGRVDVRGLGLESEWSANIRLRGTTTAPAIMGRADLVKGDYLFAGRSFDLTHGRITFDGSSPPNPLLDIAAEATVTGLTARVRVGGTSLRPEITFTSAPAMPEEEVLARLLFGNSITQISAPEALQLGAALASLRSGGGLDPINRLRAAIGLDRLRIIGADAALGHATGVAVGKNISRRLYAEIVTDGRGYSATQLEFRVTSWLSLLASVSTIGRESINVQVRRDY